MNTQLVFLEDCPHFKSEWLVWKNIYKHIYSADLCELKAISSVTAKELDVYSSRETYSHPFCPRVYKYGIERNRIIDSQITFDIRMIVQHVPKRMSNQSNYEQRRELNSKIKDILLTLVYLRARFGPFRIKRGMIGWTDLGVVKIWINQDFSSNQVEQFATCQQEMVSDFLFIFQSNPTLKNLNSKELHSLRELLNQIEEKDKKEKVFVKKEAFKQIENYEYAHSQNSRLQHKIEQKFSSSKNNITFSYSNKDLTEQTVERNNYKKCSIGLIIDQNNSIQASSNVLTLKKEFTFGDNKQSSTQRIPFRRRPDKTLSAFILSNNNQLQVPGQIKIKRLSDHFGKSSNISNQRQVFPINQMRQHISGRPEFLHYSTSSNPYSKFINKKMSEGKSLSNECSKQYLLGKIEKQNHRKIVVCERTTCEYSLKNNEPTMKSSQQIKNELDALFHLQNEFDEQLLENELDNVFL